MDGYLPSGELGLLLRLEVDTLEFYRAGKKERLLTAQERLRQVEQGPQGERERLLTAQERTRRAEEEAATLREELDRLRKRLGID